MPDKIRGLPFGEDDAPAASSASTPADQIVEPEAGRAVVPCLDGDDSDADLDGLSDDALRSHFIQLGTSRDPDVVARWLKALGVLGHRGLARPRGARCPVVDVPPARPEWSRASARRRLVALLRRAQAGELAGAEALAVFLAVDLVDSGAVRRFRTIARGIREGLVDPRVVRAAYKAAKRPGVERPSALLWWCVVQRSPGLGRVHAARR